MTVSKIASFAAMRAVLFVSTIPAVASPLHPTRFFHRSPSAVKAQTVVVEFRSLTNEQRELQIGKDRFPLKARGITRLSVSVGAPVIVHSNQNRRVDGSTLMTVNAESGQQQIIVD